MHVYSDAWIVQRACLISSRANRGLHVMSFPLSLRAVVDHSWLLRTRSEIKKNKGPVYQATTSSVASNHSGILISLRIALRTVLLITL